MEFIEDVQFDAMGVFRYSREPGTVAGTLDGDPSLHVPDEIKAIREGELMLLQQEIAFENASWVAEQESLFDVLVDGSDPQMPDLVVGRCYHQAPEVDSRTIIESKTALVPGSLVRCRVVGSDGYDLLARPEAEFDRTIRLPISG